MHARADTAAEQSASWPDEIFAVLQRFDVRQVPYVPDAGHSRLIERVLASPAMRGIALTTEEEGVALLVGAFAGGQRGVLLMQSSGVGNCVNMLSLTQVFRFPFLTLVTMRGEWGEFKPRPLSNCAASRCCGPRTLPRSARWSRRRPGRPTMPARRRQCCCRSA
jgi:hypothetical protein